MLYLDKIIKRCRQTVIPKAKKIKNKIIKNHLQKITFLLITLFLKIRLKNKT
jgi:hypothetical protein